MKNGGMRRSPFGGRHVDRRRPLAFTFDGARLTGFEGDTVASALLANGRRLVARSYKYHRPRGILGSGAEEPNAYVGIDTGTGETPNLRATEVLLADGMRVRSQNRFPGLAFDLGALSDRCSALLPAGFYYKTFIRPRFAWKHLYEPLIRRAAGMGRPPVGRDPDAYEQFHCTVDVLVVGSGPAGLAATRAAADAGARVLLVEQMPWVGGRLLGDDVRINGMDGADWAVAEAEELARRDNVELRLSTMAAAVHDHNYTLLYETPRGNGAPRRRLWRVRAERIVLAAGAIERPILCHGNDRPGVMLASAVRDYLRRWAVVPGSRAVVHTCGDDAYGTALALLGAGVEVLRIVDVRRHPDGPLVEEARSRDLRITTGASIAVRARRGKVSGVEIVPLRSSGRFAGAIERIDCDLVALSGGWSPTAHLYCHSGGQLRWDEERRMFRPDPDRSPLDPDGQTSVIPVGAANGLMGTGEALKSGAAAGRRAAAALGLKSGAGATPRVGEAKQGPPAAFWIAPDASPSAHGKGHFVDFQHDVTLADLELAVREGYDGVELAKRYTTLGMAPDQGKVSGVPGHAVIADAAGTSLAACGTTTFRPPYTPVTLGAIAGANSGPLFRAVRETPLHDWHRRNGADFEPVGDWRRPYCYLRAGEFRETAVAREVRAVRGGVGIIDASTLGKLLVRGPDAAKFLDLVYTNMLSTLAPGRCRYALMCNEAGFLFDDGVVARLAEDTYLCHTTSGGAERVHGWLEEWLQAEWFDLRVFVANVTEQWAQIAVAGPRSREVLVSLGSDIDFSEEALPPLAWRAGTFRGAPVRVFGVSFSGELAYEIATPAGYGSALWHALLDAGQAHGILAYGTEALHVMRAEKGFIMIGDETDGTVTPHDLALSWAVSKKKTDFLGKRGMQMPAQVAADRRQLVGLLTEDPNTVLPDGACGVGKAADGSGRIIGHVTSSYRSPTLGRSIAMALVERGSERGGEVLSFPVKGGKPVQARVSSPAFLDALRESGDG